jgi:hypothetical protein
MSSIYATDDLETGNWALDIQNLDAHYTDLFIGFTDRAPVVEFKNLHFGFELRQNENIKKYGVFPPPGVKYICTDQQYLTIERLYLEPASSYTLYLWCENDNKKFDKEFQFTTPQG